MTRNNSLKVPTSDCSHIAIHCSESFENFHVSKRCKTTRIRYMLFVHAKTPNSSLMQPCRWIESTKYGDFTRRTRLGVLLCWRQIEQEVRFNQGLWGRMEESDIFVLESRKITWCRKRYTPISVRRRVGPRRSKKTHQCLIWAASWLIREVK